MGELFKQDDIVVIYDSTYGLSKGIVKDDQVEEYASIAVMTFNGIKIYSAQEIIKIS